MVGFNHDQFSDQLGRINLSPAMLEELGGGKSQATKTPNINNPQTWGGTPVVIRSEDATPIYTPAPPKNYTLWYVAGGVAVLGTLILLNK